MRILIIAVVFTAVFTLLPSQPSASVGFIFEKTITIPGLTDTLRQVKFKDIDGDGIPEVLAASLREVTLYSMSGDSVLLSVSPAPPDSIETILLDDIDRDGVPDIIFSLRSFLHFLVTKYSGAHLSDTAITRSYPIYYSAFDGCISGPDVVAAQDFDNDGHRELLVSDENVQYTSMGLDFEHTIGEATLYFSFPDSITTQWPYYFRSASPLPMPEGKGNLWLGRSACDFTSGMGIYSLFHSWDANLLDGGGAIRELSLPNVIPCQFSSFSSTYPDFKGYRINTVSNSTEFLTTKHITYQCSGDTSTLRQGLMNLYRIHADLSVTLDWSIDVGNASYSSFLFPPDLPGHFLAFTDNSVVLFREADGSIKDIVSDIPSGIRLWDYPDADGKIRLIALRGDSISIYKLDVTTGVNDGHQGASDPGSFIMGNPYPNPSNLSISFGIGTGPGGNLKLEIYNVIGQSVATIYDAKVDPHDLVIVRWETGGLASGIYFARATLGDAAYSKKVMLLK